MELASIAPNPIKFLKHVSLQILKLIDVYPQFHLSSISTLYFLSYSLRYPNVYVYIACADPEISFGGGGEGASDNFVYRVWRDGGGDAIRLFGNFTM